MKQLTITNDKIENTIIYRFLANKIYLKVYNMKQAGPIISKMLAVGFHVLHGRNWIEITVPRDKAGLFFKRQNEEIDFKKMTDEEIQDEFYDWVKEAYETMKFNVKEEVI